MIFDHIKENKINKEYEDMVSKATKQFLKQRNAIRDIYDTAGYREIVRWFTSQKAAALHVVMASKKDNIRAKARYEMSKQFLVFLENLVNSNE